MMALAFTPQMRSVSDHATLRAQIEAAVEAALDTTHRLIALLDIVDGDVDLEVEDADNTAAEWVGYGAHRFNVGEAA